MNIVLWVVQVLLALHTVMGAVWKFSNSEQAVGGAKAMPHSVWMALSVLELICAACLVLPAFRKPLAFLIPIAALCIAGEMLLFCGVHLSSGAGYNGQMTYWLVVAAVCAFIAFGRLSLRPL